MTPEHGGKDPEELSEKYRRFMAALGSEGIRGLVEQLTEAVEANPRDTEALSGRGLAYEELGDHRRAVEDYGSAIALDPDNAGLRLDRARAYSALEEYRSAIEDYTPPSGWPRATPRRTAPVGDATPSLATWPRRSTTSTWPSSWPPPTPTPTTTGG